MAKLAIIWALIYASELFASHIPYSLHEEQARLARHSVSMFTTRYSVLALFHRFFVSVAHDHTGIPVCRAN